MTSFFSDASFLIFLLSTIFRTRILLKRAQLAHGVGGR